MRKIIIEKCKIDTCPRPMSARGWCHNHYEIWRLRGGDPSVRLKSKVGRKFIETCRVCGAARDKSISRALCSECYRQALVRASKVYLRNHREDNRARCRANYYKNRERRIEWQRKYNRRMALLRGRKNK